MAQAVKMAESHDRYDSDVDNDGATTGMGVHGAVHMSRKRERIRSGRRLLPLGTQLMAPIREVRALGRKGGGCVSQVSNVHQAGRVPAPPVRGLAGPNPSGQDYLSVGAPAPPLGFLFGL